jgi:glutamine amidotransferase
MTSLESGGFIEAIQKATVNGKPLLGICLGMQLLFESSEESGVTAGLGILSGKVVESSSVQIHGPTFGWEHVSFGRQDRKDLDEKHHAKESVSKFDGDYYFAHSYEAQVAGDTEVICSTTREAELLVAGVRAREVSGIQFHPEKSGPKGLELLSKLLKFEGALF